MVNSSNLNQIINGDKIVCVGYANLINYLLNNLDIKNECIITYNKEKKVGHQRNYLYLEDKPKSIPNYKINHPGLKTVFFVFDEASQYMQVQEPPRNAKVGDVVQAFPHFWFCDEVFIESIKNIESKEIKLIFVTYQYI